MLSVSSYSRVPPSLSLSSASPSVSLSPYPTHPPPAFYIREQRGTLPALLARPLSSGFCTFQSVPFCPSEADALNKMTTVICLCHSGPGTGYVVAQKYSARGGGRMCVWAGSNSFFSPLFSRELPFPLSLRWQVYLKPATTPPLIHTAL